MTGGCRCFPLSSVVDGRLCAMEVMEEVSAVW